MTSGLSLRGITRRFAADQPAALTDVDLDVAAGSCTALLGPSGSGKTTLLRAAAGLEPAAAGSVQLAGRDLARVPPERRGMAMVFQRPLLFPHLTVRDNVAFPGRAAGLTRQHAREEAARFLDLVGLSGLAGRDVRALSGGQQQRVALARALAAHPQALLLDEPFAALDPALRQEMLDLLLELRAVLEPTVLMVTHDHEEASAVADEIAVLIDGRLVQHDAVDTVYRQPAGVEVHRLLGGVNELPGAVRDGMHESAFGRVPLPDAARRAAGPSLLLVRHEQLRLTVPDHPTAHLVATVETVRQRGGRQVVSMASERSRLVAEVATADGVRPGDVVGLAVPTEAVWPVPMPRSGSDSWPATPPPGQRPDRLPDQADASS